MRKAVCPDPPAGAGAPRPVPFLAVCALAVALALVLLFRLDHPALWFDEVFTAGYIRHDFAYLFSLDRPDERHPAGYYILLKAWTSVFGDDRVGLRSLSVLFAALCIPLYFGLLRQRLDMRTALFGTLFFAVFPWLIHHGREARMYAPLFAFLLLSSLFYLRFWNRMPEAGPRERLALMAGFALSLAACFHLQYSAVVYYACFALLTLVYALRRRDASGFVWATAGLAVATLIALPQSLHMLGFVATPEDEWIPKTDLATFIRTMQSAFTADIDLWIKRLLYPVYLAGFWLLWRTDRDFFIFAVVFLLIGPLILAAIGLFRPTLLVRTVLPMTLLAPLLLAIVAARLPWIIGAALSAVVVGASIEASASRSFPAEREPMFIEQALPVLESFDPETDRLFFMEHLYGELILGRIIEPDFTPLMLAGAADGPGTTVMRYEAVDAAVSAISARLADCAASEACGRTIVILEDAPRFEVEAGARLSAAVRSMTADNTHSVVGHTIHVFRGTARPKDHAPD